jgi:hypothetical protein
MSRVDVRLAATAMACCLSFGQVASAETTAQDRAFARSLFDQGRALMKEGTWTQACPKLEESQRLDPGVGTQFNLAVCFEHVGRFASAWSLYLDVASATRALRQPDRERAARESAAAIEPKISKLVIVVPEDRRAVTMEVKLDGTPVGPAGWEAAMPADPGSHRLEVSAPGRKTWVGTIALVRLRSAVVSARPRTRSARRWCRGPAM